MKHLVTLMAVCATLSAGLSSANAQTAGDIQISITNEGNSDFSLTPLWFGFHNGGFDSFNVGSTISPGLQAIAEVGSVGAFNAEFAAGPGTPGAIQGVATAPGGFAGAPVIEPNETGNGFVTPINPANYQYFNFASMLIGSNDLFIGNDNALAYQVFDSAGNINDASGIFEVGVFESSLFDAGSEINDPSATGGAAFIAGAIGTDGTAEGGTIQLATQSDLDIYNGAALPTGTLLNDTNFGGERIATIRISLVPTAIPEPSSLVVIGLGLGGMFLRRRRS